MFAAPRPALARRRLAPALLAAFAMSLACVQGARAPQVPVRGTLAPGEADPGGAPAEGPLAVVFGSPKGQTTSPAEISLVFNRPMRPLDLAGDEATAPATIRPAVPGRWSWVGTSGLTFVPEDHLPRATEITVEVPAGTRALDGSALAAPYRLSFRTERPKVARIEPWSGKDNLTPDTKFELRFNQPVTDAEITRSIALAAGDQRARVAFDVRRPDPANEQLAELAPRAPLPRGSEVELTVAATLRGREGPLPAAAEQRFEYRTYGPLRVDRMECDTDTPKKRCAADGGVSIVFTNAVRVADAKRAISIEPPVKIRWPSWLDDDDMTSHVSIGARFTPGRSYRLKVAGGALKDVYDQPLASPFAAPLVMDDLWPEAKIGLVGSVFEPGQQRDVPVASINVRELELAVGAMTEEAVLALEADPSSPGRSPKLAEIAALPGGKLTTVRPGAAVNRPATQLVKTDEVLGGKGRRGPVAIGLSYAARPGTRGARTESEAVIAQVTDLAVSAKVSPYGSLVWVTRLSTGAPVAGAAVTIRTPARPAQAPVITDASGFAVVPEAAYQPARGDTERGVIFVRSGDDWTYRRAGDTLNGWRFGVSFDFSEDRPFGMIFSDRGIYRPGDTVRLKGIFREESKRGTATPAGRTVDLKVEGPDGEDLVKLAPVLSSFGTFAVDVKIPETGRLGTYGISATVQGSPRGWADASSSVEVAEYRPAEFKASVESDRPSYVRGDKATWTARGDYLFGAPMAGADARFSVTRAETRFTPPGLDGFTVSEAAYHDARPESSQREYEVQDGEAKLDAQGQASMSAPLSMPGQRGTEEVTCDAFITDVSRQQISARTTALVHPAELYVALREPDLFVKGGDALRPEVLAVDPKGARVPGVAIRVALLQRTWTVARQASGGSYRTVSAPVDKVVATCSVTSAQAPQACELRTPGAGYFLVHATAADRRGNPVGAAAPVYATGEGAVGWGDSDQHRVELVPDRESYKVGQTARILVKSPFASADALVTVERAGVYTKRRVPLAGGMPTIEVPITEDLRPNAFVSVLLVRGHRKAAPAAAGKRQPDVGAPAFRLGYAPLQINPEARRLKVSVRSNKADYRPGEPITVDVDVKDRGGKPARAEVTLYAVDEGVLSLIDYETPDPIRVFAAPRSLKVATIESREALARVRNPFADLGADKGLDGGDGAASSMGVRRDFRANAYYHPALITDAEGKARASFQLPDSLTTYRIMAVTAAEDDRFGYGESRVTTSRPLMARPALPRFLRAGDAIDAGVVVTSKGLGKARVDVEIAATGLTVSGDARRSIDLDPGQSKEVRFAIAAPRAGRATLRWKARGGGAEDTVEVTREVKSPASLEAAALYGDTAEASAEKLGDLAAIRDDVGGLEVTLASTALVGLGAGMEQLIEYPYGCTEQLTSRLVPLVALRDLARDFKLPLPGEAVAAKVVAEILSRQRGNGGFGLWAESPETNAWVTAYALWGLHEAKRRGVQVPALAIERATAHLRDALEKEDKDRADLATAPFLLYVLAEAGAPDPGRASRLFEQRAELPLFSKALLAHALVLGKGDRAAVDQLAGELEGSLRLDGPAARAVANQGDEYAVLMDSEARTSALVLRALLAARPSHPLAPRLAAGLLADRRGGTWRTTQETAWALLALDQYRKAQEKAAPDFDAHVFLGQTEIFSAGFHGRSVEQPRMSLPAANLAAAGGAPLAFSVEGTGRLFYQARLRYARKQLPARPLERGFFVQKTLRAVRPEELSAALATRAQAGASRFAGGDLVLGEVVVVTPSPREFVVIDDPLPAGFEAVDARLATTGRGLDVDRGGDDGDDEEEGDDDDRAMGRAYNPSQFLREIRDDRVLFVVDHMAAGMYRYRYLARATTLGAFVLPPTRAEEMYTPEVFGRSGAGLIRVEDKVEARGAAPARPPR